MSQSPRHCKRRAGALWKSLMGVAPRKVCQFASTQRPLFQRATATNTQHMTMRPLPLVLLLMLATAAAHAAGASTKQRQPARSTSNKPPRLLTSRRGASARRRELSPACPVKYGTGATSTEAAGRRASLEPSKPLLFAGTHGACQAGCQPRNDVWSKECELNPLSFTTWGTCDNWQQAKLVDAARGIAGGAMLRFSPCELYAYLRGRTLWVIGDSHMKNMFPALRCFMLDFFQHSVGECAASTDAALQEQLQRTALYPPKQKSLKATSPPRCVHLVGGGRICMVQAVRGEQLVSDDPQAAPGVLQLLHQRLASPEDVFLIGQGRWYTPSCAYDAAAYAKSLEKLGRFYEATRARWPNLFYSVPPHDHGCSAGKDWNAAARYCPPAPTGVELLGQRIAKTAHSILDKYGVGILDSYNISVAMNEAHINVRQSYEGRMDCVHFCRPGLPEMDIFFLHQLLKQRVAPVTSVSPAQQFSGCGSVQADFPKPYFYQIGWPGAGGHRRSLLGAHDAAQAAAAGAAGVPPE